MADVPSKAKCVVIGAGIVGNSLVHHLAELGWTDIVQLDKAKIFKKPIVTRLSSNPVFNVAEDYHQNYATLHPNDMYIRIHDAPKVENLRTELQGLYKAELSPWK